MKILETKNLVKHFEGVYAVDELSIGIEQGIITAIVGPNGSGKTTLVNILTGILEIDEGTLHIDGLKLGRIKSYDMPRYNMTRTFQNIRLFEQISVLDNIFVVLTERNLWSALFEKQKQLHLEEAEKVLKRFNLLSKKDVLAVNLSYGQRKLLEIARAIATKSQIFIFDEPFAGLFPEMRKVVSNIIRELKKEGKTVVLIEHNIDLIRELSDYVFVLDSGKLLAEGKAEEVLKRAEVIEAYLGE